MGGRGGASHAPIQASHWVAVYWANEVSYSDGEEVRIGDKVKLWEGCYGVIVASIDAQQYSVEFPQDERNYLKVGVLINSDQAGLIHYAEPDEDLELVERSVR